ncbi:MAG: DUF2118 domain-containing protein [Pyrodictiaceae archaeon]
MSEPYCSKNPYMIPRLYVEGVSSDEYLVQVDDNVFEISVSCRPSHLCLGKAIYGVVLDEMIDLVSKKALRDFIVVLPPDYTEGLWVRKGAWLEPIPLEGMRVALEACEGIRVREGDTLGYIATGKLEIRIIRSHVSGIVVYIYSSPESRPEKNIVFVTGDDSVSRIRVQYS